MGNYTVILEFQDTNADTPKDAAEQIATWLVDNANRLVFEVTDSIGNKTTINLDIGGIVK